MTRANQIDRPVAWVLWIGIVLLALSFVSVTRADPDLWGHVRFGADILDTGRLVSDDPYSFTQDRPWINHEWLSEAAMGAAWLGLGATGLSLLKGALVLGGLWLVWWSLSGVHFPVRLAAVGGAFIGMAPVLQTLRPQLWSVGGLAALCLVLSSGSRKVRWLLPVLFAVWANAHGGWIVGLGVLWVWALASAWSDGAWVRWASVCALSAGATLVTPYGVDLWTFIAGTVRPARPLIEEWRPLWALGPTRWLPWAAAAAALPLVARTRTADRWPRILVLLMLACVGLRVARVAPLFVEVTVLFLAPALAARWPALELPFGAATARQARALAVALLLAGGAVFARAWFTTLPCVSIEDVPLMPEAEPVRALRAGVDGRLVTFFNWGEYALWHLGPRLRVSMDGRRETVYSDRRLREHDDVLFGRPAGFAVLEAWRPEYVWLPAASAATKGWLASHGYRMDFESERSFVAVRDDLPELSSPGPGAGGPRRCFPH